jgi:hypothetical protein
VTLHKWKVIWKVIEIKFVYPTYLAVQECGCDLHVLQVKVTEENKK